MLYIASVLILITFFLIRRINKLKDTIKTKEYLLDIYREQVAESNVLKKMAKKPVSTTEFILTPELYEQLREINSETYEAYKYYQSLTRNVKYVFYTNGPENSAAINALKHSVAVAGVEATKEMTIGTTVKELFYKPDWQIEAEKTTINRAEFLLYHGLLLEKYIESIEELV